MSGGKTIDVDFEPCEAFDFGNVARNIALVDCGMKPPRTTSTGTTIVACCYKVSWHLSSFFTFINFS